jgi:hypothetical protein
VHRRPSGATKAHCPPSRACTARFTSAGMCRDPDTASGAAGRGPPLPVFARGRSVAPFFRFSNFATSRSRAWSNTASRSPGATRRPRSSWARANLAWNVAPAVNRNTKRSGARGFTTGRGAREGRGIGAAQLTAGPAASPSDPAAGFGAGVRRMVAGTSGCGATRATRSSTSFEVRCRAASNSSRWFSGLRCGARSFTAVRCTAPVARSSRSTGKRRAVRAAVIRR